ncbi:MAG: hypothetical protein ACK6EB_36645 [Planctomyces sp.]|jgi:hypothetical protein
MSIQCQGDHLIGGKAGTSQLTGSTGVAAGGRSLVGMGTGSPAGTGTGLGTGAGVTSVLGGTGAGGGEYSGGTGAGWL